MATPSQSTAWRPPMVLGIPSSLQRQAASLQGAYNNAGRMSDAFAELRSKTDRLSQAASKNRQSAQNAVASTIDILEGVQSRIKALVVRVEQELSALQTNIILHVDESISGLQGQRAGTTDVKVYDLTNEADAVADCTRNLLQSWQQNEEEYMATLAQVVVFNSWTSAWPEALRTVQGIQRGPSTAPPQYAPSQPAGAPESVDTARQPSQGTSRVTEYNLAPRAS